jgi:Glycosyl hydrolase family 12
MRTVLAAQLAAARRAEAARHHPRPVIVRLCNRFQHVAALGAHGAGVVVRNDSYGGRRECLANVNRWGNFALASSPARRRAGREPVAFPNIFYGCSWGVCSPGTSLPRRLGQLRDPVTSWYTAGRPSGRWNAAYDIWFARRRVTSGQDHGAEIMLWLRTGGLGRAATAHSVLIDHRRWQLEHWITRSPVSGDRWPLIIFRMVHPRGYVRHLALMPFFRRAEALGLLHRSFWLTAVEAGFEVWRGGAGLRTTSFWVRP